MTKPAAKGSLEEWPVSWEENRRAQLRTILKSTPARRLQWLEEAIHLAAQTGALQRLRAREMKHVRSLFLGEAARKK